MRDYPVGKAQQMVLSALGIAATGFGDAQRKFEDLGLSVTSKREGRQSVPVVEVLDRDAGAFNAAGEGVTWQQYPDADFTNIQQWIKEE